MQKFRSLSLLIVIALFSAISVAQSVPSPSEFLKFEVGADRQLADYSQISSYFKTLAAVSKRLQIQTLGKTTLGKDMIMAIISTEENLRNQSKYKEMARKLVRASVQLRIAEQLALMRDGRRLGVLACPSLDQLVE